MKDEHFNVRSPSISVGKLDILHRTSKQSEIKVNCHQRSFDLSDSISSWQSYAMRI